MLIIHGDHELNSRNFLNRKLESLNNQVIHRYEAKDLDYTLLLQELSGGDLFGNTPMIVIFGFFALATGRAKEKLSNLFKSQSWENLILYENKSVNANSLKAYKHAKVENFAPDKLIFQFLKSFYPGNQQEYMVSYQKLLDAGEPIEMIFFMLIRQARMLVACESADFKLPPWQKTKLLSQSRKFGDKLLPFHENLYLIDKHLKTGNSPGLEAEIYSLLLSL